MRTLSFGMLANLIGGKIAVSQFLLLVVCIHLFGIVLDLLWQIFDETSKTVCFFMPYSNYLRLLQVACFYTF